MGLLMAAAAAHAGCSRPIEAPMAPIGLSVTFDGNSSSGIYPTLLSEVGAAAGCQFLTQRVPRARQQRMFDTGQADLLAPASASPARESSGEFVPLIQVRVSLLTLTRDRPAPRSLAELLALPDYKVAVVRGFSFGPAYDQAMTALRERKRLIEESDTAGVARALREGIAHASVMTASIFIGTLVQDADLAPLVKQVQLAPLEEMGWSESGVYLSRQRLNDADRSILRRAFVQIGRSGRTWQLFNELYPPGSLVGSIRPL